MAEKMKFVLNRGTVGAMLKGNGFATQQMLMATAQRVTGAAGEGFEARAGMTATRARVAVLPVTPEAIAREKRDHVLARSIGAARG